MKNSLTLVLLILLFAPFTALAHTNDPGDDKLVIKGDINDDIVPRSLIETVGIYKSTKELKFDVNTNSGVNIQVYNASGILVASETVSNYSGQRLVINISAWKHGKYNIVITNLSNNKTGHADFSIAPRIGI